MARRKRIPTGRSIRFEGARFSPALHIDERNFIGRGDNGGDGVTVDRSPPMPPLRKAPKGRCCVLCGALLSIYNDADRCQRH